MERQSVVDSQVYFIYTLLLQKSTSVHVGILGWGPEVRPSVLDNSYVAVESRFSNNRLLGGVRGEYTPLLSLVDGPGTELL